MGVSAVLIAVAKELAAQAKEVLPELREDEQVLRLAGNIALMTGHGLTMRFFSASTIFGSILAARRR